MNISIQKFRYIKNTVGSAMILFFLSGIVGLITNTQFIVVAGLGMAILCSVLTVFLVLIFNNKENNAEETETPEKPVEPSETKSEGPHVEM